MTPWPPSTRHRRGLRLPGVHSEEVSVPFAVEPTSGCGRRLLGQLRSDKSGDREMQQPLALPGDRAAPQRQEHRSAKLGRLQLGHRRWEQEESWNTAFMPPSPPPHTLVCPNHILCPHAWPGLTSPCRQLLPPPGTRPGGCSRRGSPWVVVLLQVIGIHGLHCQQRGCVWEPPPRACAL
ncbi:transmembrane protein 141 isoform X1 [Callithrix jacchus]